MDGTGPDRWGRITTLFERAAAVDSEARGSLLDETCASDPELRRELERLLAAHDAAGDFLGSLDPAKSAALMAAAQEPEPLPGEVGRYRIVRRLGGGAMGVVYLAHDPELDRPVALKLLRPKFASAGGHRRLLEEARAASALDHPNVAVVHEVGQTAAGRAFIAMAWCEGESLAQRMAKGPLGPETAVDIARQVADALAAAHALGIVHRDVKPGNVMLSPGGRARLTDFGIASVAGRPDPWDNAVAGTPAYMSPEQIVGGEPDRTWDIWAFGVLLHEMLTGRRPGRNTGDSSTGSVPAVSRTTGEGRAAVPSSLARLIARCLSPSPEERPTAAELAAGLRTYGDRRSLAPRWRQAPASGTRRWGLAAAAVLIAGAGVVALRGSGFEGDATAGGSSVAILPFAPVAPDSALERLGRELVVTLSASLDGAGGVRVVPPIAVLGQDVPLDPSGSSPVLGAGFRVTGQLTRSGRDVRVDAALFGPAAAQPSARATAVGPEGDITALTDSVALALLRSAWPGEAGVAPRLSAVTTRSVPAMRAWLEGELDIAYARFRPAAAAFERAFRADSTFWFAYWRYAYARSYHGDPIDSAIVATVVERRASFPEPDRLLVEARMRADVSEGLALRRIITERHPTWWPAWFDLGDQLVHHGPFLGIPLDEIQAVLRRVNELQPRFLPALEHEFWGAIRLRDAAAGQSLLDRLTELRLDTMAGQRTDLETLEYFTYLVRLARTGGEPNEEFTETGVRVLTAYTGPSEPEWLALSFANYGFYRAQLEIANRVMQREQGTRIGLAHLWASALSWAGRGGWDSAFVAARQYARTTPHERGALWAYGLVSAGAWLGRLDPDSAASLRPFAARAAAAATDPGNAELNWLDGLLACTRGDTATLRSNRDALRSSPARGAPALARSLASFHLAAAGRAAEAARALADLERENANRAWHYPNGPDHPFATGVNRLAAARLLLQTGDTTSAAGLLLFHAVNLPQTLQPMPGASMLLGSLGLADLARIEADRGRTDLADRYRTLYEERVDLGGRAEPRCVGG